jgi:hypothetical protein
MTVIRLYTKIINTSDFAGKLIQGLILKGYRLNVIFDKTKIEKFTSTKIANTDKVHFSDFVKFNKSEFFNYDILINLTLKFIPQFSSYNNFVEIFNSSETDLLNERITYFNFRGYPLKIFENSNLNL